MKMTKNLHNQLNEEILILNLQLFADTVIPGNAAGNMMTSADGGLDGEFRGAIREKFLREAKSVLAFDRYAKRENIEKRKGKTITFFKKDRAKPEYTKKLAEGMTPDPHKYGIVTLSANIDQYGDWALITDVVSDTALHDMVAVTSDTQARQAAETYDIFTRNDLVAGAQRVYAPTVNDNGTVENTDVSTITPAAKMTVRLINEMVARMKADNIPPVVGNDYVMYIHPWVWYDLIRDPEWQEMHKHTDSTPLESGELGRISGCRFVETTQAMITKDGAKISADGGNEPENKYGVFHNVMVGREAYALIDLAGKGVEQIFHGIGEAGAADPLNQRCSVGFKFWYGFAILDELAVYDVVTGSYKSDEVQANFVVE